LFLVDIAFIEGEPFLRALMVPAALGQMLLERNKQLQDEVENTESDYTKRV
jgi:hypothetical protein